MGEHTAGILDETEIFNPLTPPSKVLPSIPPIAIEIPTAIPYTGQGNIIVGTSIVEAHIDNTELLHPIYVFSPKKTAFIESVQSYSAV